MLLKKNNIIIIKSKILKNIAWLEHGFSTKFTGISFEKKYLNMGFNTEDFKKNILKNRKIFAKEYSIDEDNFVLGEQVHGTKLYLVKKKDIGKGSKSIENSIKGVDGLITYEKNIPILTMHADCTPIFIADIEKKIIALLHSGLKGTIGNIVGKTIKYMKRKFNTNPKKIKAFIGPSIGICCYEVNEKILSIIRRLNIDKNKEYIYKNNISLKKINYFLLKKEGVEKIEISKFCTGCRKDLFFSYRKENGVTGRMAAIMMIK